jgi:UDP-glucose 4-epimerase
VRYALLGGRGILGSGFRAQLEHRGAELVLIRPQWQSIGDVSKVVCSELVRLLKNGRPTTIIWAAGVGHVGASEEQLAAETAGVAAAARALHEIPLEFAATTTVLFASSAGALFAGVDSIVDENTPPKPIAAYGWEKLRQEELLRRAAEETGAKVVACRMSNLYGLAEGRLSARGLVSTAVRCTRLRQPMTVFVSPDTRRDYVLNSDAAALALHACEDAPSGFSTALIREGRTRTVAEVLGLVGAVARRRVPAVYAERPESRLQPRAVRFAPPTPDRGAPPLTPMEAGIARMVMAPLA